MVGGVGVEPTMFLMCRIYSPMQSPTMHIRRNITIYRLCSIHIKLQGLPDGNWTHTQAIMSTLFKVLCWLNYEMLAPYTTNAFSYSLPFIVSDANIGIDILSILVKWTFSHLTSGTSQGSRTLKQLILNQPAFPICVEKHIKLAPRDWIEQSSAGPQPAVITD